MPEETEQLGASLGGLGIPNLSEAIEKLKAHPEIISMAASVLGQSAETATPHAEEDTTPSQSDASEKADASVSAGSISDAIPQLMGLLGPMISKSGGAEERKREHGKGLGRSTALLLALKPYLSKSRCETIDKLVQIGKVGEIFEKLS